MNLRKDLILCNQKPLPTFRQTARLIRLETASGTISPDLSLRLLELSKVLPP